MGDRLRVQPNYLDVRESTVEGLELVLSFWTLVTTSYCFINVHCLFVSDPFLYLGPGHARVMLRVGIKGGPVIHSGHRALLVYRS